MIQNFTISGIDVTTNDALFGKYVQHEDFCKVVKLLGQALDNTQQENLHLMEEVRQLLGEGFHKHYNGWDK